MKYNEIYELALTDFFILYVLMIKRQKVRQRKHSENVDFR